MILRRGWSGGIRPAELSDSVRPRVRRRHRRGGRARCAGSPRPRAGKTGCPRNGCTEPSPGGRRRLATRGAHPGGARAPEAGLGRRRLEVAGNAGGLGRGGERGRGSARCGRSEWELGASTRGGFAVGHPGRRRGNRDRRRRSARARRSAAAASAVARATRTTVAMASTATGAVRGSMRDRTVGEGGSSPEGAAGAGRGGWRGQGDGSRRHGHRGPTQRFCDKG